MLQASSNQGPGYHRGLFNDLILLDALRGFGYRMIRGRTQTAPHEILHKEPKQWKHCDTPTPFQDLN